jgi:hypothetical protein
MADSAYGERDLYIDLTITGARVLRDATGNNWVKIKAIDINGTAGAASGDIILRHDSASGPIVFKHLAPAGSIHDGSETFYGSAMIFLGLYMDDPGTAWGAGSFMIIHTA